MSNHRFRLFSWVRWCHFSAPDSPVVFHLIWSKSHSPYQQPTKLLPGVAPFLLLGARVERPCLGVSLCFLLLGLSSLDPGPSSSLTSFRSLLQCQLLSDAFLDPSTLNCTYTEYSWSFLSVVVAIIQHITYITNLSFYCLFPSIRTSASGEQICLSILTTAVTLVPGTYMAFRVFVGSMNSLGFFTDLLCDLGQLISPLWASVSSPPVWTVIGLYSIILVPVIYFF